MNYYQFHIGDYMVRTLHLSPIEDIAYRRLLDLYYSKDGDIPHDIQALARLLRMREHAAEVESVLREFFIEKEGGWAHERCDEEIAKYLEAEPEREAKKENERERQRRSRERRKELFDVLRERGEVPAFDTPMHALQEMVDRVMSRPVTRDATGTQEPITNNQEPVIETPPPGGRGKALKKCPPDFNVSPPMLAWARGEVPGLDLLLETAKFRDHTFATTCVDWEGRWRNWMRKANEMAPKRLADVARMTAPPDPRNDYKPDPPMTPEQREAANKAREMAMAAFKTSRVA